MGGSNSSLGWANSDQMSQLFSSIMPLISKLSGAAQTGQGITTNTSSLMPNAGWFNNLSPEIKQGMWEPYNEAGRNMINQMGGNGMVSARGGFSGSGQTALADLYSKAGTQVGSQAWNMINPIQQQGFTNPWSAMTGYTGTGAGVTPSAVVNPGSPSVWSQAAPFGMALGANYALNNSKDIWSGLSSLFNGYSGSEMNLMSWL